MAWLTDNLRAAIEAVNPFARREAAQGYGQFLTAGMAIPAYLSSGMLRKVIDIPAHDRVREWRDFQADADQITALEAEEKRLGIIAKVKQAEVLRGIGGAALILAAPGDLRLPINPRSIRPGALAAVNVVSRWQLTLVDIDKNMASLTYGLPRMFRMTGASGSQDIHPSRVVCFRGDPLPMGAAVSEEEAFWGASRLLRVMAEVAKSDNASLWFAELVKKAKLLRVGIPKLSEMDPELVAKRIGLIATGESTINATVYDSGDGEGKGEAITDYQVNFAGIPAMMDMFDQRIAAVSDIPFTRLMGRSPAGMNATGESDNANWNKMVVSGQKLELRPCLDHLDDVLFRSAGVDPAAVTWRFAPLDTPTEKQEAETFKIYMEAAEKLQGTGAIPDVAFNKGMQNLMAEREYMPGLDQALSEIPEDERFGLTPEDDGTDPSALQAGKEGIDPSAEGGEGDAQPRRRAANDAKPRPLYVQRKLLNADDLIAWAKDNGFTTTLAASDMHVTVLYSRTPVDPIAMGDTWSGDDKGRLTIKPGGPRAVERLGDTAVVLLFACDDLTWRHKRMVEAGPSHDFPEYQPHVTLTYDVPAGFDLDALRPYAGELVFGPEIFEPLDLDWKEKVVKQ